MAMKCKAAFGLLVIISIFSAIISLRAVEGHDGHYAHVPAPAPGPTSDGVTIDQGIACGLMLLALVLTYIIHASDAPLRI